MPIQKTTVNEGFYSRRTIPVCSPPSADTNWVTFNYDSYYRQYNSPQSRPKPDPLDRTVLAKQTTSRLKPSRSDWTYTGWYWDYACSPKQKGGIYGRVKGIGEYVPTMPSSTVDWQTPVLLELSERYVNIGSSLAEYRATASQFYEYGKAIQNGWHRWKGLKKGRAKLTPCSIPAAELAYSFGIKPLTEDLFSSVEALALRSEQPIHIDVHKTVSEYSKIFPTVSGFTNFQRRTMRSHRINFRFDMRPSALGIFNVGNPTTWAWELIPFSFVVDWAIPVGDWLQAFDIIKKINNVGGTRTIKEAYTSYWKVYNTANPTYPITGEIGKLTYKSHERKLASLPVPPPPRWKPSLSWHKVYRALSLLVAVNQPCRKYSGRRM